MYFKHIAATLAANLLILTPLAYAQEQTLPVQKPEPVLLEQPSKKDTDLTQQTAASTHSEHTIQEILTLGTMLQNFLQAVTYKMELLKLQHQRNKLLLENELQLEKNRYKLAQLTAEKDRLLLENELETAKQTQLMAKLTAEKERLELENAIKEAKQKQMFQTIETEHSRLAIENALREEKNKQQEMEIQLETLKLNLTMTKLEYEKTRKSLDLERLNEKIAVRSSQEEWESQVNKPKEYLEDPYTDGHLIISDRRILLDGPIFPGTADYISERIHYFNNKNSRYPIFLVIDQCVGGSVMEGARIISAMRASHAPVYVVVKSLAASMAAAITALAERSFVYPHAIIVHHQIWGYSIGNKIQQQENLKTIEEWSKRIMEPIAQKMGITLEQFVEQMYEHNSEGNWREFAEQAVQLKWVDTIIEAAEDVSITKQPGNNEDELNIRQRSLLLPEEKVDAQGNLYVKAPHLEPTDFYYMYNPNNYYR